ncbi:uncharacterized protein PHACADRAFT_201817 [Phanerochaete carnosa HHB-10118-sp]|uniref:Uncharacterized protein n=1 Tax=Phanerochaete carnosa (strain HHB-10118-sp) TaxID=650164 RepID=K5VRE4_PHACS|nr:uncharacterized protein PHACADRAFT_201817 [Phanerochaete carnosa HHB-10118-sp]EKM49290.1 hypothetical protein PHACADRAFT_201817 [Phanerochaete carnosa HHB-10118-sp]
MSTIITRAANRVFVGMPIYWDSGYVYMMVHFKEDVSKAVKLLTILPGFMKRATGRKTTVIDKRIQQCLDYLRAVIDDQMATMTEFGKDWADKAVLRECERHNGPTIVLMFRNILQPVTLLDGTFLSKGMMAVTPMFATHFDEVNYPNTTLFNSLRSYKSDKSVQPQLITMSADYITFGHGKHDRTTSVSVLTDIT